REGQHLVTRVVADLSELREVGDLEVDRAAGLIGEALVEHHADEAADVGDGRGRPRLGPGREHLEALHVGVEAGELGGGQVQVVDAELAGLGQDAVVDVGDVTHAARLVAEVAEPPLENVVGQVRGRVPEVRRVVRRDAARVHGDDTVDRLEGDDRLSGGVVQAHGGAG